MASPQRRRRRSPEGAHSIDETRPSHITVASLIEKESKEREDRVSNSIVDFTQVSPRPVPVVYDSSPVPSPPIIPETEKYQESGIYYSPETHDYPNNDYYDASHTDVYDNGLIRENDDYSSDVTDLLRSEPETRSENLDENSYVKLPKHNWSKFFTTVGVLMAVTAVVAGIISFIVDKFLLTLFSDKYDPAPFSQHVMSSVIVLAIEAVYLLIFIGMAVLVRKPQGFFYALLWVGLLSWTAWIVLTSFTLTAVAYAIPVILAAVSLSYIPSFFKDNTYI